MGHGLILHCFIFVLARADQLSSAGRSLGGDLSFSELQLDNAHDDEKIVRCC
jgi:hypothetical protein